MAVRVFVFGTLKEGFPNFHVNRGRRTPGDFVTLQAYPLHLVGERRSPWMLDQPGVGLNVRGQMFEVDDAALVQMDVLERVGEPDGYRRVRIEVVGPPGTGACEVFAYLKDPAEFAPLAGDALGPLADYTLEHAALYRSRKPT
ncbi:MAG: gamma-glutamylcyclotransferase family protein [Ramlibacter sp.]